MSADEEHGSWMEGLDPYQLDHQSLPVVRRLKKILDSFIRGEDPGDVHEIASSTGAVLLRWLNSLVLVVQEIEMPDQTFERNLFDILWFLLLEINTRCVEIDISTANYQKKAFKKAVQLLKIYSQSEHLFKTFSMSCHMIWLFNYVLVLMKVPACFTYFCWKQGLSSIVKITKRLMSRKGSSISIPSSEGTVLLLLIDRVTDLNPKLGFHPSIIPLFVEYLDGMSTFMEYSCKFSETAREVVILMSKVMVKLSLNVDKGRSQMMGLSVGRLLESYKGIHPQLDGVLPSVVCLCKVMEQLHLNELTLTRLVNDYTEVKGDNVNMASRKRGPKTETGPRSLVWRTRDRGNFLCSSSSEDDESEDDNSLRVIDRPPRTCGWASSSNVAGITEVDLTVGHPFHMTSEDHEENKGDWSVEMITSDADECCFGPSMVCTQCSPSVKPPLLPKRLRLDNMGVRPNHNLEGLPKRKFLGDVIETPLKRKC